MLEVKYRIPVTDCVEVTETRSRDGGGTTGADGLLFVTLGTRAARRGLTFGIGFGTKNRFILKPFLGVSSGVYDMQPWT